MSCSIAEQNKIIEDVTKLFIKDLRASNPTASSKDIRAEASRAANDMIKEAMVEIVEPAERVLGSTRASEKADWNTFDEVRENVNKDIEGMRLLMRELHELGGGKATDSELKYLDTLFDEMRPEFFDNVKVFINKEAEASDGIVIGKNIGIKIKEGPKELENEMSDAEIYTHEVIHAMTHFGRRSGHKVAVKVNRQLDYIMNHVADHMTWKDFLPENSIDAKAEEKIAKDTFDYIMNSENAKDEFIAHVLTNPIIMEKMKGLKIKDKEETVTVWEKIRELFSTLVNIFTGDFDFKDRGNTVYQQVHALAFDLAEINNKNVRKRNARINLGQRLWDGFQKYNVNASEALNKFWDEYIDKGNFEAPPKKGDNKSRALWMAKMAIKMFTNKDYRKVAELLMSGVGLDPRGDLQTAFRDFFPEDDLTEHVNALSLRADKIDTAREHMVSTTVKAVHSAFNRELTSEEESAMTRVLLDTDLSSISDKFDRRTLSKLLSDPVEVDRRIRRALHKMKGLDESRYAWNKEQSEGLGYFMATGKGHLAQNINAENIARGILSPELRKPNYKVVKLIDEIATLTALKYTSQTDKAVISNLIKTERNGIESILKMHAGFKEESIKTVFKNSRTNMIKGYTREIFDDQISILIQPQSRESELLKEGYVKQYNLKPSKHLKDQTPMAVYISDAFESSEIYRTATRMTAVKSRGTSIRASAYERTDLTDDQKKEKARKDKDALDLEMFDLVNSIEAGKVKLQDIETGLMPVLNEQGYVIDYRYMMPKDAKAELLKQDLHVSEVLGRSFGSIIDKEASYDQNQNVLDMIMDDMKENYIPGSNVGANNKEYILISANSTDEEIKDLYSRLPKIFKDAIKLTDNEEMAVRADLFHNYFGYRHLSITDNALIKKITPVMIRRLIKIAEHMWMEAVKIVKGNILIKLPFVIVGNLISNFMFGVLEGIDPITLIKEYIESSRAVASYFKVHNELESLKFAKKTGNPQGLNLSKIPLLENQLKESSVYELAELGIYQSIIEDMNTRKRSSSSKVKKKLDETIAPLPGFVKQGLNILYLTSDTGYYKAMNEVLTKSDLIARDIKNRALKIQQAEQARGEAPLPKWWVMRDTDKIAGAKYTKTTKRLSGQELKDFNEEADRRRHAAVLAAFVDYNKPSGRREEYVNRMGFFMFTKYFKRIQKVIANTTAERPLNVLALIFGEATMGDIDTIYDQNIFTKNWYNFGISDGDMIPGTNPFDRLMDLINPPLVQLITDPKVL